MKLVEEETAKRVEAAIKKRVEESLNCEEIKLEIRRRLEEGRGNLRDEVAAQLEKEKENALVEVKRREVSIYVKQYASMKFSNNLFLFDTRIIT